MAPPDTRRRTADSLLWSGIAGAGMQLVSALFGLWLLRLLTPTDYGRVAALVVFSSVASVLQESGFTAALANKREPSPADYNSVFWANTLIGTAIYAVLFAAAPAIARFYADPVLCPLGRLVFLSFVISSFGTAQRAYLFGHLMVRQTAICQLTAVTLSNMAGVALAYAGLAYWALALMTLVYVSTLTIMAWHYSPWRPTLHISLKPAWSMFGFSSRLLISSLATQLTNHAFGVLLTRFFGSTQAGIYSNARKWHDMATTTISSMAQGVTQPLLVQTADAQPLTTFRTLLRFTAMLSFPALFGLTLIAPDFVVLLAGQKWAASATLLSLLCLYGAFAPIATLYTNLIIALRHSGIVMTIALCNCGMVWGGIIAAHALGASLTAMVAYYVALSTSWLLVWQAVARHLCGLRWHHVAACTLPYMLLAATVMAATWHLTRTMPLSWLRMLTCIATAATAYTGILIIARDHAMHAAIAYLRQRTRMQQSRHNNPHQGTESNF